MKHFLFAIVYFVSLMLSSAVPAVAEPVAKAKTTQPAKKYTAADFADFNPLDGQRDTSLVNPYDIQVSREQLERQIKKEVNAIGDILDDVCLVEKSLGLKTDCKIQDEAKAATLSSPEAKNAVQLSEEDAKAILLELSKRIHQAYNKQKDAPIAKGRLYMEAIKLFPVFVSLGAIDPAAKKWLAKKLRGDIREYHNACTGNGYACDTPLTAIRVLPTVDEKDEQRDDALLVYDFLEKNYQGGSAAAVLQSSAISLIALGRTNMLAGFVQKADKQSLGFWDRLGNVVSLEYWSDKEAELNKTVTRALSDKVSAHLGTERWVNRANQSSYYTAKDEKGNTRQGNIYQDLGEWLATEQEDGKYIFRNQIDISSFIHPYENGTIVVDCSAFVAGLLLGGMTLPSTNELRARTSGTFMDANGRTKTVDTTKAWSAVQKRLNETHMNTTGLVLAELYAHPKTEMSHAQRHALNNRLVEAYDKSAPQINGTIYKPKWMKKEQTTTSEKYQDGKYAFQKKFYAGADIVIAVVGVVTMAGAAKSALSVAKLSSFGIRTMSRARGMIAVVRGQRGALTVSQLRSLAKVRAAFKASAGAGAWAGRELTGVTGQSAKVVTETVQTGKKAGTVVKTTAGVGNTATTGKNLNTVANVGTKAGNATEVAPNLKNTVEGVKQTATAGRNTTGGAHTVAGPQAEAVNVAGIDAEVTGALTGDEASGLSFSDRLGYWGRRAKEGAKDVYDAWGDYSRASLRARRKSGVLMCSPVPTPGFMTPGFGTEYAAAKQASQLTREEETMQAMIARLEQLGHTDGKITAVRNPSFGTARVSVAGADGMMHNFELTVTPKELKALEKLHKSKTIIRSAAPASAGAAEGTAAATGVTAAKDAVTAGSTVAEGAAAAKNTATAGSTAAEGAAAAKNAATTESAGGALPEITVDNYIGHTRTKQGYILRGVDGNGNPFARTLNEREFNRWAVRNMKNNSPSRLASKNMAKLSEAGKAQLNADIEASKNAIAAQKEARLAAYRAQQQQETALSQAAENVLADVKTQTDALSKVASHEGLLSNYADEAISVIRNGGGNEQAEKLFARYDQWRKGLRQVADDGAHLQSDAHWAKVNPAKYAQSMTPEQLAGRSAQLSQNAQAAIRSAEEMDPLVTQLRQIELQTHVNNLGQTRVAAQKQIAGVRQMLQQATAGQVPPEQMTYLKRALASAENALNSTQQTGREALAASKNGAGGLTSAIDKTTNAQRQITTSLSELDEYAKAFRQNWGAWLERGQKALAGA